MKKIAVICLGLALSFIAGSHLYAQDYAYATGSTSFTTEIPIENGYIAVNNGEIHMEIPLATQTQRGKLPVNESLVYDSRIWKIFHDSGFSGDYDWQPTNVPNSMGGWRLSTGLTEAPTYSSTYTEYGSCGQGQEQYPTQEEFWDFAWTDPQGTKHKFDQGFYEQLPLQPCAPNIQPSSTSGWALDGSGYYFTATYDPDTEGVDTIVYDKQGNEVYPQLEDTNGNYMSTDSNGNLIDTLGLTPLETTTSGDQITYSVLTFGGARANYIVTTETVYYNTDFQENQVNEASGSFTAIKSIQLPDGSSYSFTYDSGTGAGHYGELTSITLPSGGVINYTWQNYEDSFQNENRWLWTRVKDGGTTTFQPNTISLCSGSSGCQEKTTVTDPAGNDTVYTFTLDPGTYTNAGSWNTGITAYQGPAGGGVALKSVNTSYKYNVTSMDVLPTLTEYYAVPQSETVLTSLPDVGLTSKTATTFDSIGANPVSVQQWDYYSGSAPSSPAKETAYTYNQDYVNGASVPTQVKVTDASGNVLSETDYGYDQTAPAATSGLPNHDSVSGYRADLTTVSRWLNTSGSYLSTTMTYDDAGTLLSSTDPNGNITSFGHDSYDMCVKQITRPTTYSVQHVSHATCDPSTGLPLTRIDENGKPITYTKYDVFGRLLDVTYPDGGETKYTYPSPTESTKSQLQQTNVWVTTTTDYDTYGRPIHVTQTDPEGDDTVDYGYDSSGRLYSQSNPHRGSAASTDGTTYYFYDALGRITKIENPDGSTREAAYQGNTVTTTDESGLKSKSVSSAFGWLTSVFEPDSSNNLTIETDYQHDALGNLTRVDQWGGPSGSAGDRVRTFSYDTLSRLIQAHTPEGGWVCYGITPSNAPANGSNCTEDYDGNGNLKERTDARGVQTSYTYDALNRLQWKHYSDGVTIAAGFGYDGLDPTGHALSGVTNAIGRLSQLSEVAAHAISIFSYDTMGRVIKKESCIPGDCNYDVKVNATYDLAGNLKSLTNGSPSQPITLSYQYDTANRLSLITSSWTGSNHPSTLFEAESTSPASYGPAGLQYALLGGTTSSAATVIQNRAYDNRLRPISEDDTNSADAPLYSYCIPGPNNPQCTSSSAGFSPDGNVLQMSDSVMGNWSYQNPGYDTLKRLVSGTATAGPYYGQYACWQYDAFGNRTSEAVSATPCSQSPVPTSWAHYNTNNQITGTGLMLSGYLYDAAGNVLNDGVNQYLYDGEDRICAVKSDTTGALTGYIYDASGARVGKGTLQTFSCNLSSNGFAVTSGYVVGLNGEQLTETDGGTGWLHTHVFANGQLLATYSSSDTLFELSDWLGTRRADVGVSGCETTWQSLPYGDGLTSSGNCSDTSELHFTGKERDEESGNDYFPSRYYASPLGRWMSPDPYSGSYDPSNPQTFNRYSYVLNDPLSLTDPSGLVCQQSQTIVVTPSGDSSVSSAVTGCAVNWLAELFEKIGHGIASAFGFSPSFHGSLKPRPSVPNNPCSPSVVGRVTQGLQGLANVADAGLRGAALPFAVAGLSEAPPVAAVAGIYGSVSVTGQAIAGVSQIFEAISGNSSGMAHQAEQIGNILSGPASGLTTLATTGGNLDAAEASANWESLYSGGAGLVDKAVPLLQRAAEFGMSAMGVTGSGCH